MKWNTDEGNVNPETDINCNAGVSHLCMCECERWVENKAYKRIKKNPPVKKQFQSNIILSPKNV